MNDTVPPSPQDSDPSPPPGRHFASQDEVTSLFDGVLELSTADETELVWFERRHGLLDEDGSSALEDPRRTVIVRVVEGGRTGWHRTGVSSVGELASGVRMAQALATVHEPGKSRPVLPTKAEPIDRQVTLFDPALAGFDLDAARALLDGRLDDDERARVHWAEFRVAVANSHGVRRTAAATEIDVAVRSGEGAGAGRAASAARCLADLDLDALVERARHHRSDLEVATEPELPTAPTPVVLSPETTVVLLHVLNTFALAGRAYLEGSSFLVKHRNVQVFDRTIHVRDDGLRVPGLPFPFDLEGTVKRPIDLVVQGQPSTPALSREQSQTVGLRATGQAVGGQDSFFGNLFLLPGAASEDDLLAAAEGGLYIGWLEAPECFDPERLGIRAVARGVRRIREGRVAEPLPDLSWETTLLAALARVHGIGRELVVRPMPSTPLGGIAAPAIALAEAGSFELAS